MKDQSRTCQFPYAIGGRNDQWNSRDTWPRGLAASRPRYRCGQSVVKNIQSEEIVPQKTGIWNNVHVFMSLTRFHMSQIVAKETTNIYTTHKCDMLWYVILLSLCLRWHRPLVTSRDIMRQWVPKPTSGRNSPGKRPVFEMISVFSYL